MVRRRVRTAVLGVAAFCSTVAIVVTLGLVETVSAPFDQAFAAQRGAHVVAAFDPAKASDARPAEAVRNAQARVEAVAGPFGQAVVTIPAGLDAEPGRGRPSDDCPGPGGRRVRSRDRRRRPGSAPRAGRALRVQRLLAGVPLPRPVSLGLGLPLARPGRSALTLAAVVLGVAGVTSRTGLTATMTAYGAASQRAGHVHSVICVGGGHTGRIPPARGDAEIETLLRRLPGVAHVTATAWADARLATAQVLRTD